MKAIVSTKYGSPDVLQLAEVPKPAPKDDEVLVKIHAASVNPADWHFLRGKPFPVRLMATDGRESDVGHPDGETDPGGLDLLKELLEEGRLRNVSARTGEQPWHKSFF